MLIEIRTRTPSYSSGRLSAGITIDTIKYDIPKGYKYQVLMEILSRADNIRFWSFTEIEATIDDSWKDPIICLLEHRGTIPFDLLGLNKWSNSKLLEHLLELKACLG